MNNPVWKMLHPSMVPENLGYIPGFLDLDDPRPAKDQIRTKYVGGWFPFKGFVMLQGDRLMYPGDPTMIPLAETRLRDEIIRYYPSSWVVITQPDGSWEVARLD